jgi:uncharacterized membrane protein
MIVYGYLHMTSNVELILAGATMYWLSPRLRRNWVLGYGSPRSMVNDATWQAANRFAGIGLALLALVTMSVQVRFWELIEANELAQVVSVALVLALPFFVMYSTEKYLARAFRN